MAEAKHLILEKITIKDLIKLKEEMAILVVKDSLTTAEKAGLIKFFELSYELSWKTIKRVLLLHKSIDVRSGTKDIFREAAKAGYIDNPELWFGFIEDRNETVHAYNEAKVDEIVADLGIFQKELDKLVTNLLKL